MRIATVGKGGSGKTTLAGTLARIFAGNGHRVLAIDGDPNPNLALTLGLSRDQADGIAYIPPSLMTLGEPVDGVRQLRMAVSPDELLENYAVRAAENLDLIVMGKPPDGSAGSGCMCASHRAVRGLIVEMTDYGKHTVTDMEAGLEHLKRGTARNVDVMLVVAEPYYRSMETAARTFSLARELGIPHIYAVANKIRTDADAAAIDEFCQQHDMPVIGWVPLEDSFVEAERRALAPLDFAPVCHGTDAIRAIARRLDEIAAAA